MKRLLLVCVILVCVCALGVTWGRQPVAAAASLTGEAAKDFLVEQGIYGQIADDLAAVSAQGSKFSQVGVVTGSDSTADDSFGGSVAISDDTAIIGVYRADVNGAVDRGAAYVFVRATSGWSQQQKLIADDGAAGDGFGGSVAISGNVIVVGSPLADVNGNADQGAVYMFGLGSSGWIQQQKLVAGDGAADDGFGSLVAASGETLLVTAPGVDTDFASGAVYVFDYRGGIWRPQQKLVMDESGTNTVMGTGVAIDGNTALVGMRYYQLPQDPRPQQGLAIVFIRTENAWNIQQYISTNDSAETFQGVTVAVNGDTALMGFPDAGAAYVFVRNGSSWRQQQKLVASDGTVWGFGTSVAINGDTAFVGGLPAVVNGTPNQGAAYVFVRSGDSWRQQQKLVASDGAADDHFGSSVAISGDTALVGAPNADVNGNAGQGKAYFYERASLRLTKSYTPDKAPAGGTTPVSAQVTLTTAYGIETMVLTDTVPAGLEMVPGTLVSTPPGAVVDPLNPKRVLWKGAVTSESPLTLQYQVRLAAGVEGGSVLGGEVVATTSSGDHYVAGAALAVQDAAFDGALLLVYIAADTAVDGFNVGQGDLADEALRLINQAELKADTPGVRTVVMLDGPGADDARIYNLKYDTDLSCPNFDNLLCDRQQNPYTEGVNTFTWGDSVANPYSLAEFATRAMQASPNAETVLLSLVGHGGGWTPEMLRGQPTKRGGQPTKRGGQPEDAEAQLAGGLLWDMHHSDALSTADLGTTLRMIQTATGKKVDLLYLDACLMAMSEVAYEIRDGASYLLASQSWSWTTFPYDQHIASAGALTAGSEPPPVKARKIGEAWLANEAAVLSEEDNYPFTYSLTDLAAMPTLNAAQNTLAQALLDAFAVNAGQTHDRMDLAFAAAECVDSDTSGRIEHDALTGWADNYCDLGGFAAGLLAPFGDNAAVVNAAQGVGQALAAAVVTSTFRSGVPHTYSELPWTWTDLHGLTIYLPLEQDEWKRRYYNDLFLPASVDSRWGDLLAAYWNAPAPDPVTHPDPQCPAAGCPLPPAPLPVIDLYATATKTPGGIRVQWTVNSVPNTAPNTAIAGFTIQRLRPSAAGSPDVIATVPYPGPAAPQPFTYLDVTAATAYEYCYQVVAVGPAGGAGEADSGLALSNLACTDAAGGSVPQTPAPRVQAQGGRIVVEWDPTLVATGAAGAADAGSPASPDSGGYRVYRSTNRGQPQLLKPALVSGSRYVDAAVLPGFEYCYTVHTINADGALAATSDAACISLGGSSTSFLYLPHIQR